MRIRFADLWRWEGTVDRGAYALVGLVGFAIKHNLDRIVASYVFHRPWGIFNYWVPIGEAVRISSLPRKDAVFLATMVALALPFVWVGVALTVRRLRNVGLPTPLALLFFLPVVNVLFFAILCILPARDSVREPKIAGLPLAKLSMQHILPESPLGSAAISLALTIPVGWAMAVLGAQVLWSYGWGLFVALPFAMGLASVLIYGARHPRSLRSCVAVASLATLLLGLVLLALAFEGVICVLMAAPLALLLAIMGGYFGYLIQRGQRFNHGASAMLSILLVFVPGMEWLEHAAAPAPPVFGVRTALEIHAPPEKVWKQVVAFAEIPPPRELLFRAGIAYPIRAEIQGQGVGAERHCLFSTGAFIEPIEVWDEPRRLKFSVTSNPAPMQEWTPYHHVEPPHLHGFLVSNGGQFLLTPLPNGGTQLEGMTWYRHSLWPATYWRWWSDAIIHRIHLRVLSHIKAQTEAEGGR